MNVYKYELYHHGVKGMKWGVRKKKAPNKERNIWETQIRMNKASTKNLSAALKIGNDYRRAALQDPKASVKYAKTAAKLMNGENRKRFLKALNSHMDSINDDISKISIGNDFFTKHQNDTTDDIVKDGNNAMVAYMLLNTVSQNSAADTQRRMYY